MGQWIKRKSDDYGIDFDTLEELIGDMIDAMEINDVDLTKPMKVAFTVSLDSHGCVKVNEYGIMNEKQTVKQKKASPLIEMFEFGDEITAAIELNGFMQKDFDVKLLETELLVLTKSPRKIIRRFELPCRVDRQTLRTDFNNNVLEISIKKQKEMNQSMKK